MKTSPRSDNNNISSIFDLYPFLGTKQKTTLLFAICLMLLSGLLELLSVGAILPVLSVILDSNDNLTARFADWSSYDLSPSQLRIMLISFYVLAVNFSSIVRLINVYYNGRVASDLGSFFAKKVYSKVMYQEYSFFYLNNTSRLIASLTTSLSRTVTSINSVLESFTSFIVAIFISFTLMFVNFNAALTGIVWQEVHI